MKVFPGKELIKLLISYGWELARINGSHHILIKKEFDKRISVPVHGNQSLKIGLVKHILKIANIDEESL